MKLINWFGLGAFIIGAFVTLGHRFGFLHYHIALFSLCCSADCLHTDYVDRPGYAGFINCQKTTDSG